LEAVRRITASAAPDFASVNDLVYVWENFDLINPSYAGRRDVVAYP
jgi:hypothetical protein